MSKQYITHEYQLSFATPAFLGDASQKGAWRTPPFKALLRQWWRIAAAKDCNYDVSELRRREHALFGSAADDKTGGKSKVRLRLSEWKSGNLRQWPQKGFSRLDGQVNADVYLGYGPVAPPSRKKGIDHVHLEHPPAIETIEQATLRLALVDATEEKEQEIAHALQLAAWFGTLGSRSRNGWGSLTISHEEIKPFPEDQRDLQHIALPVEQALQRDWAHALGSDRDGLLLWTAYVENWKKAVNHLGLLRKEIRKVVKEFNGCEMKGSFLLGYPLTKARAYAWQDEARLPNQLRFKVLPDQEGCLLCVAHFPCTVPDSIWKKNQERAKAWVSSNQLHIWQQVHKVLDERMQRLGGLS